MNQAERIADRGAVMIDGGPIEVGPAERVFADPDDPRARKFIGRRTGVLTDVPVPVRRSSCDR